MENNYDKVHKPKHYTEGRKYEPKDVIRDWGLNFNVGSAVKYCSRAGRKDDVLVDLKKAQEFLQFEIDAIEADRKEASKDIPDNHNCKCSTVSFDELCKMEGIDDEADVKCGVIEIAIPPDMPADVVIHEVIKKLYGGE